MRRSFCLSLAVLLLAACNPSHPPAPPVPPAPAVVNPALSAASTAAHQAAARFMALAKGSSQSGHAPAAADPAVGPLLDLVFDTASVPTEPVPLSQLDEINDWVRSVISVGRTYVLAGTGAAPYDDPTGPVVEAQVVKNVAAYGPEVGRYIDAQNALLALEASSLLRQQAADPTWPRDPAAAKGLATMRSNLTLGLGAMLELLAQPSLTDDWRRDRMPYLLSLATQVAKLGDAADIATVRAKIQTTYNATDDATEKADLQYLALTLDAAGGGS
ncbi:MAG TPA: hypothetical protein VHW60_24405 [Caulobacteraceae bacterium]|jgi:hypothetical protein|nr:hypothetical protein [Caulobacteraceae bacterium]